MNRKIAFGVNIPDHRYTRKIGVYAVIFNDTVSMVATVKTSGGHYFLPGGGLESHETQEMCLRREMLEETGYQVEPGCYIGVAEQYFMSRQHESMLNEGHFYLTQLLDKNDEPIDDDHELTWINVVNVDEFLVHKHHAWAVNKALSLVQN